MICRKCGNKIGEGKAFCVICGEPVENLEGPKFIQPDNQQPTNNGYTQPSQPVEPNTPVNNGYAQPSQPVEPSAPVQPEPTNHLINTKCLRQWTAFCTCVRICYYCYSVCAHTYTRKCCLSLLLA